MGGALKQQEITALRSALADAQTALEACEARFRNIINRSADGILIVDTEGIVRFANPAAETLLARPVESLKGVAFGFPVVAGETTEIDLVYGDRQRQTCVTEMRVVETEWDGERVYLVMLRDITERKRAARKIENLARFPAENPYPVLRVTSEGRVRYANVAAAPLLAAWECQEGGLLPKIWREVVRDTLARGEPRDTEMVCDGRTFSLTFAPVVERGYINIYGVDITERKEVAAALWESQHMLRLILDHIPQAVFWKNRDLIYLGCNRAFLEDAGVDDPHEIIGKTDFELPWPVHAERYRADDRRVIESGEPYLRYEEPQTTPEGKTIWLQTSKVPLHNMSGEIIGVLGMYEDITEYKKTNARLEMLHKIDRAILEARSTEEIVQATLQCLQMIMRCRGCSVMLFDFETQQAQILEGDLEPEPEMERRRIPLSWFRPLETLRQGEVCVMEDLEALTDATPAERHLLARGFRAHLSVPLLAQDGLIGALNLADDRPGTFAMDHVEIAREVADQLAIALQQRRLHEQVERHASELEERIRERTAEMQKMVNLMSGREIRMAELKNVIRRLRRQLQEAGLEPVADDPLLEEGDI
ncbi:MAG: PAS domain-containing protein [Anaerolineae bacterium]